MKRGKGKRIRRAPLAHSHSLPLALPHSTPSSPSSLQTYWRMHRLRSAFLAKKRAALLLQSGWRARVERIAYETFKREQKAARTIQRLFKGFRDRKR